LPSTLWLLVLLVLWLVLRRLPSTLLLPLLVLVLLASPASQMEASLWRLRRAHALRGDEAEDPAPMAQRSDAESVGQLGLAHLQQRRTVDHLNPECLDVHAQSLALQPCTYLVMRACVRACVRALVRARMQGHSFKE
jgi:hypothetical protein